MLSVPSKWQISRLISQTTKLFFSIWFWAFGLLTAGLLLILHQKNPDLISSLSLPTLSFSTLSSSTSPVDPESLTDSRFRQLEVVQPVTLQLEPVSAKLDPERLRDGCFGQDCIPSIDQPEFETVEQADSWLEDTALVLVLSGNITTKIYPINILNWHEVVNDTLDNKPVVVTFCPLCGGVAAFERRVEGVITEFGVSGKIHRSNLVLYDRYEGNMWQQATGQALSGPAVSRQEQLKPQPLFMLSWAQAKMQFADSQVLSRQTGYWRDYTYNPYAGHQTQLIEPTESNAGHSLDANEQVYGIVVAGQAKAYPKQTLSRINLLKDVINQTAVMITNRSGLIEFYNLDSDQGIWAVPIFWSSWVELYPDTKLYEN